MSFVDIIAIILVVLLFTAIIFKLVRDKKRGQTCCGCSAKPGDENCHCHKKP